MNKIMIIACGLTACLLVSCRNQRGTEVVKETYIHKYGVPIAKEDWNLNGKDGQVIFQQSDGVTITRAYERGILHGETTFSYPNSSTIQRKELYNHGELKAKIENYPSGVPMLEEQYAGQALSQLTRWYEDGTPAAIEHYQNGLLTSAEYRTPLNIIESRVQRGEGTRIARGSDGDLLFKDQITNGQMMERITFFANGDPSSVTPYRNGKIHGQRQTFLQGGLPNTVENWIDGVQEGTTIVFQNGEKISELPFVKGEKHGIEYRYKDGTQLVEEVTWKRGIQHGPRKLFISQGTSRTEWYHQGEQVSRTTFERLNVR